jgi:protein TonB
MTMPVLISRVAPEYSAAARHARLEGKVVVAYDVDPAGRPANVRVVENLVPALYPLALAAISRWRFQPGTENGKPVSVPARTELNFRLD